MRFRRVMAGASALAFGVVAFEVAAPAAGPETLETAGEVAAWIEACTGPCAGVIYVWSPSMPLSGPGVDEIVDAASGLGISLALVPADALFGETEEEGTVASLVAAGATTHFPALVVHRDAEVVGPAILGYKLAATYREMIGARLEGGDPRGAANASPAPLPAGADIPVEQASRDYEIRGLPGAYFRWVPGRDAVAYEASGDVLLLQLESGTVGTGPGYIDFVPSPDGRLFVTPGPGRRGLEFYDADAVFEGIRSGNGARVSPVFNDDEMRDQYPSVGILIEEPGRTVYRVLTSWASAVVYRDYEAIYAAGEPPRIQRLSAPVRPCNATDLSIPIMSQDGMEVAGRDEATGTTKVFRMGDSGACDEVLDTGLQTRKVAWHRTGTKLAFGLARGANLSGSRLTMAPEGGSRDPAGVFILDREARTLSHLAGSEQASRDAFPDFVGDSALVYLIPGRDRSRSTFRVVDGIR